MTGARTVILVALLPALADATAQCWWENERRESLNAIVDSVIHEEAMSLIDWIWEYEGDGLKPDLLRIDGDPDRKEGAVFKGMGSEVKLGAVPFDSASHELSYDDGAGYHHLCKIDGRHFRGTDGGAPRMALSDPLVIIDGERVQLPDTAWRDLYEPNFCFFPKAGGIHWQCEVLRSPDRHRTYIHMMNSDGAGSYEVIWIFVDGKYLRRVLEGPP